MDDKKCYKKCFYTRQAAKKAKKIVNKVGIAGKVITNIYFCFACQAYHLTSMEQKKSRALNKKS